MERKGQLPDLVEEHRAAVGKLDQPHPAGIGAGERAPLVAEQFALQQGVGDRAAINGHERPLRPPAALVDRPRDEFLAGPRLAGDEDVDVAGRHSLDDGIDLPHRRTLAEESLE